MKTFMQKKEEISREWYLINAKDATLGRLASEVASLLKGKHKPIFTPHVDCGDYVVVTNAGQVKLTGDKLNKKLYHKHSGWIGGLKTKTAGEMLANHPIKMLEIAVKGMLPKNKLGSKMGKKLYVYDTDSHPHQAQNPKLYTLKG